MEPQGLGWMEALIPSEQNIQKIINDVGQVKILPGSHFVSLLDDEVA